MKIVSNNTVKKSSPEKTADNLKVVPSNATEENLKILEEELVQPFTFSSTLDNKTKEERLMLDIEVNLFS